ncbi:hypothetical protein TNCV_4256051 [Trichonephila clavipes]|nr:hypothetical protein TNCV_4256051 [Trichonephila clavipes]
MASQFGEINLRNSCLAFIQLNFNIPQRVRSLIGKSGAYYARGQGSIPSGNFESQSRNEREKLVSHEATLCHLTRFLSPILQREKGTSFTRGHKIDQKRSAGLIGTITDTIFNTQVATYEERTFDNVLLVESTSGDENAVFRMSEGVTQQGVLVDHV